MCFQSGSWQPNETKVVLRAMLVEVKALITVQAKQSDYLFLVCVIMVTFFLNSPFCLGGL